MLFYSTVTTPQQLQLIVSLTVINVSAKNRTCMLLI